MRLPTVLWMPGRPCLSDTLGGRTYITGLGSSHKAAIICAILAIYFCFFTSDQTVIGVNRELIIPPMSVSDIIDTNEPQRLP